MRKQSPSRALYTASFALIVSLVYQVIQARDMAWVGVPISPADIRTHQIEVCGTGNRLQVERSWAYNSKQREWWATVYESNWTARTLRPDGSDTLVMRPSPR